MTTAHEQIRQALELAKHTFDDLVVDGESDAESSYYHGISQQMQQALSLLDSHAVVPREPTQDNEWFFRQADRVNQGIISPEKAISIIWWHPDNPYNTKNQAAQEESDE